MTMHRTPDTNDATQEARTYEAYAEGWVCPHRHKTPNAASRCLEKHYPTGPQGEIPAERWRESGVRCIETGDEYVWDGGDGMINAETYERI